VHPFVIILKIYSSFQASQLTDQQLSDFSYSFGRSHNSSDHSKRFRHQVFPDSLVVPVPFFCFRFAPPTAPTILHRPHNSAPTSATSFRLAVPNQDGRGSASNSARCRQRCSSGVRVGERIQRSQQSPHQFYLCHPRRFSFR